MRVSILILSAIILTLVNGDSFSHYQISTFLDYLYQNGYFDLLVKVKDSFGDYITIIFCQELFNNMMCEDVVKIYIPGVSKSRGGNEESFEISFFQFTDFIFQEENLELLKKEFNMKNIMKILLKIETILRPELIIPKDFKEGIENSKDYEIDDSNNNAVPQSISNI